MPVKMAGFVFVMYKKSNNKIECDWLVLNTSTSLIIKVCVQ